MNPGETPRPPADKELHARLWKARRAARQGDIMEANAEVGRLHREGKHEEAGDLHAEIGDELFGEPPECWDDGTTGT